MKLCVDCKYLRGKTCRNPNTADTSMINGELKYYSAEVLRNISVCGVEAKWFEAKPLSQPTVEPF